MHINGITVARLVNTGNYENTRVELSAELGEGDDVSAACSALCVRIAALIADEERRRFGPGPRPGWSAWLSEDVSSADPAIEE